MKCEIIISNEQPEQVIIYAHSRTALVDEIEQFVQNENNSLLGYSENTAVILKPQDIYYFTIQNNKVYAVNNKEMLTVKFRLYQLEQMLGTNFIKINQSCIANIKAIEKFDFSIWGSIKVVFKNGDADYVSRRNIKPIKERLGL